MANCSLEIDFLLTREEALLSEPQQRTRLTPTGLSHRRRLIRKQPCFWCDRAPAQCTCLDSGVSYLPDLQLAILGSICHVTVCLRVSSS